MRRKYDGIIAVLCVLINFMYHKYFNRALLDNVATSSRNGSNYTPITHRTVIPLTVQRLNDDESLKRFKTYDD